MSRILWCGGSHLANAKDSAIRAIHHDLLRDFQADFYITAAPANRNWSADGGRYQVDGQTVFGNQVMPRVRRNLSEYAAIIFVGQWIQPWCAFRDGLPLSESLLELSLQELPLHPWITRKGKTRRWYNEPLELFPRLAPGRIILIRDPDACMDPYKLVPVAAKRRYSQHLEDFCQERGITLCPQFHSAMDRNLVTRKRYLRNRKNEDPVHMSDKYWCQLFEKLLHPILRSSLTGL